MGYQIQIERKALQEIQEAIDYYDDQQTGLGQKFEAALNKHFSSIEKNPFFQIRYDEVHCLPIRKYPYMIHFTIDKAEMTVIIRAVLHTSLDPKHWKHKGS